MEGMLCCIFNYAPLYRQAIYREIDREFDTQFCFADEVIDGRGDGGIRKMDTSSLRHPVRKIRNKLISGKHPWRSGILWLALKKKYSAFLITGDLNWAYLPFLALCRMTGKKVYGWGHGIKTMRRNNLYNSLFYGSLDGYFIYGSRGRDRMVELGFPKEDFHVIYNSLVYKLHPEENEGLESEVYRIHFDNSDPVLIFSGRLTAAKRPDMLLEAVMRLNADGVKCNLIIIGDGSRRQTLEKAAEEWEIADRVWFYGTCYDRKKTAALLYNADLCVSPGNVGLMAIHAMQVGTPVVSHGNFETQMPEYEAIVEGKTGALFKEGDIEDLCDVIRQWLRKHRRDREQIRRNCYDVISAHWTAATQIETFKSVLK
ncbi:MAG: glycosyltransferase [Bacteroidales bacterium]|nr:glycosyltransferase [Bacteroidales bacterium]